MNGLLNLIFDLRAKIIDRNGYYLFLNTIDDIIDINSYNEAVDIIHAITRLSVC